SNPPLGLAFLVDKIVKISPGSPDPTWTFSDTNVAGTLFTALAAPAPSTAPYARPLNRLGSPTCQIYLNIFVDRNASYALDPEEASVRLITSVNTLLIPSAGTATP
ncbi:MAG: hypothetical protein HY814_13150, partial [Candidatus Riflebacteria bacterium]|nr:hypothetical protein [Candidatus Riflebacteria bacterium]